MHVVWDKRLEKKWCVLNVYGSAEEDKKEDFLREMASYCAKWKDPYIVGGDFNILRFSHEKNKVFVPNRFSDMFNSVINVYDLREIHISGGCIPSLITMLFLHWRSWIESLCLRIGKVCSLLFWYIRSQGSFLIITR
jgi:hypothetical protein